jgi:pyruvate/2-oxoglutarate/acetoin dehydrogenase E1 component
MTKKRYIQAINEALVEEMSRDESIVLFGEDVEASMFGDTQGLLARFGSRRVRNTPISEASLTGMAVGAAGSGCRVVLHMMFANFLYTGMDAIANQMAKMRLMTGGQIDLPITVIAAYGGGRSSAAQHSDSPHPMLMNLGGLQVAMPATAGDAKGLLKTALRSRNPTFFLQAGGRGGELGEVPDEEHLVPLGQAAMLREGQDVTIVAIGTMVKHAVLATRRLVEAGLDVELLDPRTLVPLDEEAIVRSVRKTGRLLVVDEARDRCSAASHICALIAERAFNSLKAPPLRLTTPDTALPYAPEAERVLLPNAERIAARVAELMKQTPRLELQS